MDGGGKGEFAVKFLFCFLSLCWLTLAVTGTESVSATAKPFDYTLKQVEATPEYVVYRLEFPSPGPAPFREAENVVAYYYKPLRMAGKKAPAVVCLHILGGNGDLTRLIASYFARRGMPAIMPLMPLFLERIPPGGRMKALAAPGGGRMLGVTFFQIPGDIRKSIDLLVSFPEVDSSRVHLVGTSMGGILGFSAVGRDPRIDKAAFLLAGGGLSSIIARDRKETLPIAAAIRAASPADREYVNRAIAGLEPMNYVNVLAPKARAGKIRMINAAEDEVIPPENTRCLADALGLIHDRDFILLPGMGHYSAIAALPGLLDNLAEFFGGDAILPLPERPATADSEVIKQVFSEIVTFLRWNPPEGKSLKIAARFESFKKDKSVYSGNLTLLRGSGGRFLFRLEDASGLGEVNRFCFGRGEYPWMESRDRTVFAGTLAPENRQDLEQMLSVQWRIAQQTAILLSQLVAANGRMETLEKFVSLKLADTPDGGREIRIGDKKLDAAVRLEKNRNVPASITVRQGNHFTRVAFTCWESDFPGCPGDFEPPSGGKVRNVDCRTLERVFASGMNFLVETGFGK